MDLTKRQSAILGVLLGTAVGDALGLPYEGLTRQRAAKLYGPPDRFRFLLRWGMISDDTEHTCMVAQSLTRCGGDVDTFQNHFARQLRWWIVGIPAGIGFGTLRAIVKLWLGFSPARSGVFSAGNAPAMRSAILGAVIDDQQQLFQLVSAATSLTHTDPKAEHGAYAIALAAQIAMKHSDTLGEHFLSSLQIDLKNQNANEFLNLVCNVVASVNAGHNTQQFANSNGWSSKISGYVYQSVPVALHAWLKYPRDFEAALRDVIGCGGDTDTTGAMVGALVGAHLGHDGIPHHLLQKILDLPGFVERMTKLALAVDTWPQVRQERIHLAAVPVVLARNVLFAIVVLFHGFRRLLPPY